MRFYVSCIRCRGNCGHRQATSLHSYISKNGLDVLKNLWNLIGPALQMATVKSGPLQLSEFVLLCWLHLYRKKSQRDTWLLQPDHKAVYSSPCRGVWGDFLCNFNYAGKVAKKFTHTSKNYINNITAFGYGNITMLRLFDVCALAMFEINV